MRTTGRAGILVGCCVGAAGAAALVAPGPPGAGSTSAPTAPTAVAVLLDWDERREAAWRAGDAAALRDLYTPGSRAGRADTALLARWRSAGWEVGELRTQLLAVDVLEEQPARVRLRVTDRLAGGEVRRDRLVRGLPGSRPTTRTLTLVLDGDARWRVRRSA